MIAKFHKWTKFPINVGEPLCFKFDINGLTIISRPKKNEDHNCFAAEFIKSDTVQLLKVHSPIGIYLAHNYIDLDTPYVCCASCGAKLK